MRFTAEDKKQGRKTEVIVLGNKLMVNLYKTSDFIKEGWFLCTSKTISLHELELCNKALEESKRREEG